MIATQDLIQALAADGDPVRRLQPPFVRFGLWLGLAALRVVMFGLSHGLRSNLAERLLGWKRSVRLVGQGP